MSSARLATQYEQLARSIESGLSVSQALELGEGLRRDRFRAIRDRLAQGESLASAVLGAGTLPRVDCELLAAAAETSRIPETLRRLAEFHRMRANLMRTLWMALVYPIILVHLGAILAPIPGMLDWESGGWVGGPAEYLREIAKTLGITWALILIGVALFRADHPSIYQLRRVIPVYGKFQNRMALSNFCFSAGALLEAGVAPQRAWSQAGAFALNPALRRAAGRMAKKAEQGASPIPLVGSESAFPADLAAILRNAEATASVPEVLLAQSGRYGDEAQRALRLFGTILPVFALLLVALWIAIGVARFLQQYLDILESVING